MKFIDLFGGIGGFRLGMKKHGHECVGYYDIDKYATSVYNYNFGEKHDPTDIKRVDGRNIPSHDIICAGFPCQDHSIAGSRTGIKGERGSLFDEIIRIAKAKRTPYLFLENVEGLLSSDRGWAMAYIIYSLDEIGYDAEWYLLNSRYFVPQSRSRVFIIGHLRGRCEPKILPYPRGAGENTSAIDRINKYVPEIAHCLDTNYIKGVQRLDKCIRTLVIKEHKTIINCNPRSKDRPSLEYSSGGSGILTKEDEVFTLQTTPHMVLGTHNASVRRLTPIECERLQGFPDNWTAKGIVGEDVKIISDTQRYKMCGNAVTVDVINYVAQVFDGIGD